MEPTQSQTERTYQLITVFEIVPNTSRVDGLGNTKVLARTIDEQIAKDILHTMGNAGKILHRPGILLADGACFLLFTATPIQVETNIDDAVRSIALAKLSPEEKKSLGFS